jgi:hypothetical protein
MKKILIGMGLGLVLAVLGITGAYFLYILPQQNSGKLAYDRQQDIFKKNKDCGDMKSEMQNQHLSKPPIANVEEWVDQIFYSPSKQSCVIALRRTYYSAKVNVQPWSEYQVLDALTGEQLFDKIANPNNSSPDDQPELISGEYDDLLKTLKNNLT